MCLLRAGGGGEVGEGSGVVQGALRLGEEGLQRPGSKSHLRWLWWRVTVCSRATPRSWLYSVLVPLAYMRSGTSRGWGGFR